MALRTIIAAISCFLRNFVLDKLRNGHIEAEWKHDGSGKGFWGSRELRRGWKSVFGRRRELRRCEKRILEAV